MHVSPLPVEPPPLLPPPSTPLQPFRHETFILAMRTRQAHQKYARALKTEQQGFRLHGVSCPVVHPSPSSSEGHRTRLGGRGGRSWQYGGLHIQRGFPETQKTKGNSPYFFFQSMAEPTVSRGKQIQTKNKKMFSQGKCCYGRPLSWTCDSSWGLDLRSSQDLENLQNAWDSEGGGGCGLQKACAMQGRSDPPEVRTPLGQTVR